jgi:hypothetical protein
MPGPGEDASRGVALFTHESPEERIVHISAPARGHAHIHARLIMFFFLVAATALASAHPFRAAPTLPQRFDGTWEASHGGKVIIVLRLHSEAEYPSGTIQLAGFQLDFEGDGAVMAVTDDRLDTPITLKNIKQGGKILSFDFVDSDGDDDKFQMELTDTNSAKLQWVGLPSGFKALPIPVTRRRK